MRTRVLVALALAIALVGGACGDDGDASSTPSAETSASVRSVPVLRVACDVPLGALGGAAIAAGAIEPARIPADVFPATAVTDRAAIESRVAVADLVAGQVVVEGMFVGADDAPLDAPPEVPPC